MFIRQIPYLVMLLTPLSYAQVFGIRVVLLQAVLLLPFLMAYRGDTVHAAGSTMLFFIMVVYVSVVSAFSEHVEFAAAMVVFFLLAYWPVCLRSYYVQHRIAVSRLSSCYLVAALITALGVLLQIALHKLYGVAIGKIDHYGLRTAYGFVWSDYSFLSLYLVSAIPLAYGRTGRLAFMCCAALLITASLATTARTGMVALIAACLLLIAGYVVKSLHTATVTRRQLVLISALVLLIIVSPVLWQQIAQRDLSLGGSGRMTDYAQAFNFWIDHHLLGVRYDLAWYKENVGTFPHNMFIFMTAAGGLIALILFLAWIATTLVTLHGIDRRLLFALAIVVIGMQFIPSFFSAYFLAALLSLAFLDYVKRSEYNKTSSFNESGIPAC